MSARDFAETHRAALIEIGWECGPVEAFGVDCGFEVLRAPRQPKVEPHRRSFDAAGTMTIMFPTRHGRV